MKDPALATPVFHSQKLFTGKDPDAVLTIPYNAQGFPRGADYTLRDLVVSHMQEKNFSINVYML